MKPNYAPDLLRSTETGEYQTAEGVPPTDFARLTHQLRYQANKLGLDIHIVSDRQKGKVSFRCFARPSKSS